MLPPLLGSPALVVEVLSASTAWRACGVKREDYAAHGVAEHWIVDAGLEAVTTHRLEGRRYVEDEAGATLQSEAAAGFAVPTRALFDDGAHLEALRAVVQ